MTCPCGKPALGKRFYCGDVCSQREAVRRYREKMRRHYELTGERLIESNLILAQLGRS